MPSFDYSQLPIAYLSENKNSKHLRRQLIKNLVKQPKNNINKLSDVFFSQKNIEIINKQLVLAVWKKSKKRVFIFP